MNKKLASLLIFTILIITVFSGCLDSDSNDSNKKPKLTITYPLDNQIVSNLVMISGTATDPDGDEQIIQVEVKINDEDWLVAEGISKWSYDWSVFEVMDGTYTISARAWDGTSYSDIQKITIDVENPTTVETDSHKWAIFVASANFPIENESKLGKALTIILVITIIIFT